METDILLFLLWTVTLASYVNISVSKTIWPIFFCYLRAIGTGDSKGPLIFLRGISYHEIEAVLEFMYNGQTKVQQTELDAFLAAAEELKIKGLTTNPTGNTHDSSTSGGATSRKRPSTHIQHSEDSFDNGNGQQKSSKMKKSRPVPNAIGQAGPSSAHSNLFDYLICITTKYIAPELLELSQTFEMSLDEFFPSREVM